MQNGGFSTFGVPGHRHILTTSIAKHPKSAETPILDTTPIMQSHVYPMTSHQPSG